MVASSSAPTLSLPPIATTLILVLVLGAYTLQTLLATYVQHDLEYQKPYFLFWLTHSGYLLLTPLHLLFLRLTSTPLGPALESLLDTVVEHYTPSPPESTTQVEAEAAAEALLPGGGGEGVGGGSGVRGRRQRERSRSSRRGLGGRIFGGGGFEGWREVVREPWVKELARKVGMLTVFISAPALSWYAALPLTDSTSITCIYNSFAFWAYLLSLYYLPSPSPSSPSPTSSSPPRRRKCAALHPLDALSVLLAMLGVFIVSYGDEWLDARRGGKGGEGEAGAGGSNPVVGNALALLGSLAFAGYEVFYKLHIALPTSSSSASLTVPLHTLPHSPAEHDDEAELSETSSLLSSPSPTPSPRSSPPSLSRPIPLPRLNSSSPLFPSSPAPSSPPPSLPPSNDSTTFLLYSTLLTSLIGLTTLLFLWLPLPILHFCGWEAFELPPREAWISIVGIVLGGVVFNGGFMVVLSVWGPVVASISNLLTLLLVSLSSTVFLPSASPLTGSTLLGGGCIVLAFGGVIWGEVRSRGGERGADGEGKEGEVV